MLQKNKNDLDDYIICKVVLNGNTEAFRLLIEKYQSKIFSLGFSFLKNADDAQDFVQDVMVKSYINLPNFLGKAKFSTWLMSIAYNTAINSKNKKKEYTSLAENYDCQSMVKTPEQQCIERDMVTAVKEAVQSLPEKYRICVDLYFFYNMPYADIADVTKLPINTIKSNVFRAKKILKGKLDSNVTALLPNIADAYAGFFKQGFAL